MANVKCTMCGRTMVVDDHVRTVACVYCGTRQEVPGNQYTNNSSQQTDEACRNAIYIEAKKKMSSPYMQDLYEAEKKFLSIPGWIDADEQALLCRQRIQEFQKTQAEKPKPGSKKTKWRLDTILIIVSGAVCVITALALLLTQVIIPNKKYNDAVALMEAGKYEEADTAFKALNGYKDSDTILDAYLYQHGITLSETKESSETDDSDPATEAETTFKVENPECQSLGIGIYHSAALKTDGTVVAKGMTKYGQCDVSGWSDIVSISVAGHHTIGLKADGTVVATGKNEYGQCNVSDWTDIVAISTGLGHTVGLKSDGTVVAVGLLQYNRCDVSDWTEIVAVSAGRAHTVGLKADGTVVAVGLNENGQCNVSDMKDIVAISAGGYHTLGLKANGKVVAVGSSKHGQCSVSEWSDMVAISAGDCYSLALRADGTAEAVGYNVTRYYYWNWTNVVTLCAGYDHSIFLKSDGTLTAYGLNKNEQCDISHWKDIVVPKTPRN